MGKYGRVHSVHRIGGLGVHSVHRIGVLGTCYEVIEQNSYHHLSTTRPDLSTIAHVPRAVAWYRTPHSKRVGRGRHTRSKYRRQMVSPAGQYRIAGYAVAVPDTA
eukprot:1939147-Rhodomonas_salina.3